MVIASSQLVGSVPLTAQLVDLRVDPRIELVSWAFRLAGRGEYNSTRVPCWQAAIDSRLAQRAAHEAVAMSRRMRCILVAALTNGGASSVSRHDGDALAPVASRGSRPTHSADYDSRMERLEQAVDAKLL